MARRQCAPALSAAVLLLAAALVGGAAAMETGSELPGNQVFGAIPNLESEQEAEAASIMLKAFSSIAKEINTGEPDDIVFSASAEVTSVNASALQAKVGVGAKGRCWGCMQCGVWMALEGGRQRRAS